MSQRSSLPAHAKLSASSSKRWMECPGSVKYDSLMKESASSYAEEGTKAHELAEAKLKLYKAERGDKVKLDEIQQAEALVHTMRRTEMDKFTDIYVDYITGVVWDLDAKGDKVHVFVEERVSFSDWVPEGFGTVDCCAIGHKELHVFDLKYGKGVPVHAQGNTQARIYALGALQDFDLFGYVDSIESVTTHIIQPRLDNISSETLSKAELMEWAEKELKPKADKAWRGVQEFKSGKHCKFCKIRGQCKYRAYEALNKLYEVINGGKSDVV